MVTELCTVSLPQIVSYHLIIITELRGGPGGAEEEVGGGEGQEGQEGGGQGREEGQQGRRGRRGREGGGQEGQTEAAN